MPFTSSDAVSLVMRIGRDVSALLRTHRYYHNKHLYAIDTKMELEALNELSRKQQALSYLLSLGVVCTHKYNHRISKEDSEDCTACKVADTFHQVMCRCVSHSDSKPSLRATLIVGSRNLICADFLGSWQSSHTTNRTTALVLSCKNLTFPGVSSIPLNCIRL